MNPLLVEVPDLIHSMGFTQAAWPAQQDDLSIFWVRTTLADSLGHLRHGRVLPLHFVQKVIQQILLFIRGDRIARNVQITPKPYDSVAQICLRDP
jgi:predicted HD phosphohydrolase